MDERDFYTESPATRPAELVCPYCRTRAEYHLRWLVRRKKPQLPRQADAADRARFARADSYMVLLEDRVRCSNRRCNKSFEISGIKTLAFLPG